MWKITLTLTFPQKRMFSDRNVFQQWLFSTGMTFRKGVCNPLMNGAIVYDDGNFFGINNNVHELGHL